MRETLTILAVILIVILTAAIVGPYFVDWNSQRALIEAQLSNALGARVATSGDITLRLLPTPYLVLGEVRAAGAERGAPHLAAETARVELSAMPLLQGQLQVTEATFDRPNVRLTMGEDGQILLPQASAAVSNALRFERIVIKGGTLIVDQVGSGREWSLEDVNGTAEAHTLKGPFLFEGTVQGANGTTLAQPLALRFTTGAEENGQLQIHASSDETGMLPQAAIDGAFIFDTPGNSVTFDGMAQLNGSAPQPWRLMGALHADTKALTLDKAELHIGPDPASVTLRGKANVAFADAPRADIAFESGPLDLDHLLAAPDGNGLAPQEAAQRVADRFANLQAAALPLPVAVNAKFALITLSGGEFSDVTAQAVLDGDHPAAIALSFDGPGRAHVALTGAVTSGTAPGFSGHATIDVRDAARLRDWLQVAVPVPFRAADFEGDVKLGSTGLAATNARLAFDASQLAGAFSYDFATAQQPPRLTASVMSPLLDIEGLPDLATASAATHGVDLDIKLDARAAKIARFGQSTIDAGQIACRLRQDQTMISLDRCDIAGLGGANVSAKGRRDASGGFLTVTIDAQRLNDFATLLQHVAPGTWSDALATRAASLSPAHVDISLNGGAAGAAVALQDMSVAGVAGGTRLIGQAHFAKSVAADIALDAPEGAALLQQLGFPVLNLKGLGPGHLALHGEGADPNSVTVKISGRVAGVDVASEGGVNGATYVGRSTLAAKNAAGLAEIFAILLPDQSSVLPLNLQAQTIWKDGALALNNLAGDINGNRLLGTLTLQVAGNKSMLSGGLSFDTLPLSALTALALGPQPLASPNAIWPNDDFGAALLSPPESDLSLVIKTFDLGGGLVGKDAKLRLGLAPGRVDFNDLAFTLGQGAVQGHATLRRDGKAAALSGHFDAQTMPLANPALQTRASASLDFASTGASVAALVSGLAGSGTMQFDDLRLSQFSPNALSDVLVQSEKGGLNIDETNVAYALAKALDHGALDMGPQQSAVSLAAGVLQFASMRNAQGPLQTDTSASFDLKSWTLAMRSSQTLDQALKFWTGAPPGFAMVWRGPWTSPKRGLELGAFVNGIAAQAIARDTERIQELEADIRERAMFNRRLKAFEFMDRRDREIAQWRENEARRQAEEARRQAEEAARKAALEKQQQEQQLKPEDAPLPLQPSVQPPPAATPLAPVLEPQPAPQ
ncbi:AsmA family protein [Methylovirgula sp. 4M-Z18]|uniref:AsmA family protein n=1 Tax=Methylovirgula sp. 4M-Z18 TaxID=2293567 RepID=UPI0013148FF2|nr:AsmA family protein [Methylovirgula sp. 4M-Z18]